MNWDYLFEQTAKALILYIVKIIGTILGTLLGAGLGLIIAITPLVNLIVLRGFVCLGFDLVPIDLIYMVGLAGAIAGLWNATGTWREEK